MFFQFIRVIRFILFYHPCPGYSITISLHAFLSNLKLIQFSLALDRSVIKGTKRSSGSIFFPSFSFPSSRSSHCQKSSIPSKSFHSRVLCNIYTRFSSLRGISCESSAYNLLFTFNGDSRSNYACRYSSSFSVIPHRSTILILSSTSTAFIPRIFYSTNVHATVAATTALCGSETRFQSSNVSSATPNEAWTNPTPTKSSPSS